jgi:hypothetical protein
MRMEHSWLHAPLILCTCINAVHERLDVGN